MDQDAGINLDYFGKRFYDPETGIFTSTDPAMQDWSSYSYCGGNPTNYTDPDGAIFGIDDLIFWGIVVAVAGAYTGGSIAQSGTSVGHTEWNPGKWDWDNGLTYVGMGIGAGTGFIAGYAGAGVLAGSSLDFTATLGYAWNTGADYLIGGLQAVGSVGGAAGFNLTGVGIGLASAGGAAMLFAAYQQVDPRVSAFTDKISNKNDDDFQRIDLETGKGDPNLTFIHQQVASQWSDLPLYIQDYQPIDLYGQVVSRMGDHANNLRLPGGYHLSEESNPSRRGVWVHKDIHDPSRNPWELILHTFLEARRKPPVPSEFE